MDILDKVSADITAFSQEIGGHQAAIEELKLAILERTRKCESLQEKLQYAQSIASAIGEAKEQTRKKMTELSHKKKEKAKAKAAPTPVEPVQPDPPQPDLLPNE